MESKRLAAERATEYIENGMIVGLGTGSTAYWAIQKIGEMVRDGLEIKAIATSKRSEEQAEQLGIPLVSFAEIDEIDITIDGADEVDPHFHLIKGGGGALLREKIVAAASKQLFIVVDESKVVGQLGKFPLPVEVVTFGYEITLRKLHALGCTPTLRIHEDKPYRTDNGNLIVDCQFDLIEDPTVLHDELIRLPGVVDNGLFIHMANKVFIGYKNGEVKEFRH